MPEEIPLSDLPPGRRARVTAIDDAGGIGRRLADLGLVVETPVRMLRRAPLGDPAVYELRGYQLCLRRTEASRVRVRVETAAEAAAGPRA